MRIGLNGMSAGLVHYENEKEPVDIFLRLPLEKRTHPASLKSIGVPAADGSLVSLGTLVHVEEKNTEKTIYHKNLKRVTYVTGDVAGSKESPVYAIWS